MTQKCLWVCLLQKNWGLDQVLAREKRVCDRLMLSGSDADDYGSENEPMVGASFGQ